MLEGPFFGHLRQQKLQTLTKVVPLPGALVLNTHVANGLDLKNDGYKIDLN